MATLGHPFAQRGDDDLAADDDHRRQRHPQLGIGLHQHNQDDGDHDLVGHGVEEGAERRLLVKAPCQVAIEPIGQRPQKEGERGRRPRPLERDVEQHDQDRKHHDPPQRQRRR